MEPGSPNPETSHLNSIAPKPSPNPHLGPPWATEINSMFCSARFQATRFSMLSHLILLSHVQLPSGHLHGGIRRKPGNSTWQARSARFVGLQDCQLDFRNGCSHARWVIVSVLEPSVSQQTRTLAGYVHVHVHVSGQCASLLRD